MALQNDPVKENCNEGVAVGTHLAPDLETDPTAHQQRDDLHRQFDEKLQLPSDRRAQLVIALDFGTTFSTAAYAEVPWETANATNNSCLTGPMNDFDIETVQNYPDADLSTSYLRKQVEAAFAARTIPPSAKVFRYIKLILSEGEELAQERMTLQKKIDDAGKTPIGVIADFLGALWNFTLEKIPTTVDNINSCRVHPVLAVPAVWSPKAVRTMMKAAELAGIGVPDIVSEPEAAALNVLRNAGARNRQTFEEGDIFVVVDAGGGTVDLVSYELTSVSPFAVDEAAQGKGGLCGSSRLNSKFEEWFTEAIAPETYSPKDRAKVTEEALKGFERAKRTFSKTHKGNVSYRVPGLKRSNASPLFNKNTLHIPCDVMRDIFDSIVMDRIVPLIEDQIRSIHNNKNHKPSLPLVKYIILVGGFSASRYLFSMIRDRFNDTQNDHIVQYPIKVLSPEENHEIVVGQGSVLRCLSRNFVRRRRLRTSFGIKYSAAYDKNLHDGLESRKHPFNGSNLVDDCVQWVFKRGDVIGQREQPDVISREWTIETDFDFKKKQPKGSGFFDCKIYISDEEDPQTGRQLSQMEHVEFWGRLEADFSQADFSNLEKHRPKKRGRQPTYYVIPYYLQLVIEGMHAKWKMTIPTVPGVITETLETNITSAFQPGQGD